MLAIVLPIAGVWAQESDQIVSATSQRYSIEAPDGWYASNEPALADLQAIFPTESITIADNQASLAPLSAVGLDIFQEAEFTGAALVGTVWPADLVEVAGFDPATFGRLLALGADGEATHEPITHDALSGDITKINNGTRTLLVAPLVDAFDNMLLLIGAYEASFEADIDATLSTLQFTAIDNAANEAPELTIPITILADTLEVDVPPGWWILASPDATMASPDFDASFMDALDTGAFADVSGTFLLALNREKSSFPDELYDEEGRIKPDVLVELFDLANMMGISSTETDFGEVSIVGEEWTSSNGIVGVQLDMVAPENNLVFRMIVLDNDVDLAVLMAMSTANNWDIYEGTISAIFDTVRFLEAME
jgi:hypothetical protein